MNFYNTALWYNNYAYTLMLTDFFAYSPCDGDKWWKYKWWTWMCRWHKSEGDVISTIFHLNKNIIIKNIGLLHHLLESAYGGCLA